MAQSTEQYRLNTYMYIEIMNVVIKKKKKKKRKCSYINTAGGRCTGIDNYIYIHPHPHAHTHTHTHTHTHHAHAHTHKCAHTNTKQTAGAKDNNTQLKRSEKRHVSSLLLKERRELECLTSWGRLFQI